MNRRSILSSLSSMCLAALAWPRNAAGEGSAAKTKYKYTIKVKNAFVGEGGELVAGSSTLNVWAYGPNQKKTLTGGAVSAFSTQSPFDGIRATIYAAFPEMPIQETSITILQEENTTLYYLAYADSLTRTRRITIKQAPDGVTF